MSKHVASERTSEFFRKGKPFFAVIFLQFGLAGMDVISKVALNEGMSNYVFVVYRHAVATVAMAPFAMVLDKYIYLYIYIHKYLSLIVLSFFKKIH